MNFKCRRVAIALIVSYNLSAWAQMQEPPKNPSAIESFVWSILPLVVIAAFIWFVFIKGIRKVQEKSLEAHRQHNETMEKLLERIARALEKKDGGSV